MADLEPALYGINSSNSDRSGSDLWGKNQFNSAFPLALCLKMRDDGIRPVYVCFDESNHISANDNQITMSNVVEQPDQEYYSFETQYPEYQDYTLGNESIDLVVFQKSRKHSPDASRFPVRPLEVKLTVVPDVTTSQLNSNEWAPELVVRPISSAYAMLGIASRLLSGDHDELLGEVTALLHTCCQRMQRDDWTNVKAVLAKSHDLVQCLDGVMKLVRPLQSAFLIQAIWRTIGQTPMLDGQCFDVFVWSNLAVVGIPLMMVKHQRRNVMNRNLREVVRHVSALYALCTTKTFNYVDTYGGMGLSLQTDKSFAISGKVTGKILRHPRLRQPHYGIDDIPTIILNGGESLLKPERRLDAALVSQVAMNDSLERNKLVSSLVKDTNS